MDIETINESAMKAFRGPKPDLVINKVPKDTLAEFKHLAREAFYDDYGFTLKWLLDLYLPKNFELEQRISILESKIDDKPSKDEKVITLGNGKKIVVT